MSRMNKGMTMNSNKEYLGDSVYAEFNGAEFVLTTENGLGPSNTIYMDVNVVEAFSHYIKRILTLEVS